MALGKRKTVAKTKAPAAPRTKSVNERVRADYNKGLHYEALATKYEISTDKVEEIVGAFKHETVAEK